MIMAGPLLVEADWVTGSIRSQRLGRCLTSPTKARGAQRLHPSELCNLLLIQSV